VCLSPAGHLPPPRVAMQNLMDAKPMVSWQSDV
jgi:hypothetical protein